jgi:phage FluMu gp28-like protein
VHQTIRKQSGDTGSTANGSGSIAIHKVTKTAMNKIFCIHVYNHQYSFSVMVEMYVLLLLPSTVDRQRNMLVKENPPLKSAKISDIFF